MVDPDPGYRPRRAHVEPEEAAVPTPAKPDDTDAPPPLFRDEVPGAAGSTPSTAKTSDPRTSSPKSSVPEAPGEETRIVRPLNFRQRRPAPVDEDATTLLPRTDTGSRRPVAEDEDEPRRGLLGRRGRLALLASALVAVIVVGAAIIYAVSSVGTPATQVTPSTSVGPTSGSGSPSPDPNALLGDAQLLSTAEAAQIDDSRTWKVALTQRGPGADTPTPACLTDDPVDGQPTAQQQVLQLLSSSGKSAPSALHQATEYASPEDAAQAYALAAKAFGGCAAAGSYISGGATVTGIGDQAAGLVVNVLTGGKTQWHSIVLSRTGRVLNIVDAAQPGRSLLVSKVAAALAAITATQCQAAGGTCATTSPQVTPGPPPLGGDVPGFLATGDLPPAGNADESWVATPAAEPSDTFLGSQCETVTWTRTGATTASTRVYLVPSSAKFGLNDIVLTMKSEQAATSFATKIRDDLKSCSKRQLTATVTEPAEVRGTGASGAKVSGWTSTVSQKSTNGTQQYRVGIVSSGTKVAYTFMNTLDGGYDLTQSEWDIVAVRAGQRMTQAP